MPVKSKVKILQNFVAFSEYMNFIIFFPFQTNLERAKDTVINMGAVLFSGIHVTNFLGVIVLAFAK